MDLKRITAALLLISIVAGCFAVQLYQQKTITIANSCLMTFPISYMVGYSIADQPLSNNATRMQIADYINTNPGVQFRGICAGLCLPIGLVQYHLGVLVKSGLVSYIRDGRYKRFFTAQKYSINQIKTISVLRHKTARKIVEALLIKKELSHGKLAYEVSISSPALTWQMKSLRNIGFLVHDNFGLRKFYSLSESSIPQLRMCLSLIR